MQSFCEVEIQRLIRKVKLKYFAFSQSDPFQTSLLTWIAVCYLILSLSHLPELQMVFWGQVTLHLDYFFQPYPPLYYLTKGVLQSPFLPTAVVLDHGKELGQRALL